MPLSEFATLKCACGGELFTPLERLKYKDGGGTVREPAGHFCIACQATVDNAYMARLMDRQRKLDEIKRLQSEVGETPAPKVAAKA